MLQVEFLQKDDLASFGPFVAGQNAAIVATEVVALVEAADGSGLQFGDANADGFLQSVDSCFVSMDKSIFHDDEQIGRQLLKYEIFCADFHNLFLFGERIEHDDFLHWFGDDVILIIEEGSDFLVKFEGGFGSQFFLLLFWRCLQWGLHRRLGRKSNNEILL